MAFTMEGISNFKTPSKLSEKKKSGKIADVRFFFFTITIVVSLRNVLVLFSLILYYRSLRNFNVTPLYDVNLNK